MGACADRIDAASFVAGGNSCALCVVITLSRLLCMHDNQACIAGTPFHIYFEHMVRFAVYLQELLCSVERANASCAQKLLEGTGCCTENAAMRIMLSLD